MVENTALKEGAKGKWIVHVKGQPVSEGASFRTLAEAEKHLNWLPKGDAAPIYGQLARTSSKTPGHSEVAEVLAKQAAESGQYKRVYLGTSVENATGHSTTPRRNPDVLAVDKDGKVHIWEVESGTDNGFVLLRRGENVLSQLPEAERGSAFVARPAGIVKDVNAANSQSTILGKTSAQADAAFAAKQPGFMVVEWSK